MSDNQPQKEEESQAHKAFKVPSEEAYIQEEITEAVKFAENNRIHRMGQAQFRRFISATTAIICLTLSTAFFGWDLIIEGNMARGIGFIILSLLITSILNIWSSMPIKAYQAHYKTEVMPRLAKALGGFTYSAKKGISQKLISKTRLLPQCKYYSAEDCFTGQHQGNKIMFSEARLSNSKKPDDVIFNGLFLVMKLPEKRFEGHCILTTDPKQFERLGRHLQSHAIDSEEYQNHFKLFSNNEHDARLANNNSFLKELDDAHKAFERSPLSICFFDERYVFFMISHAKDMFESSSLNIPIVTVDSTMQVKGELEQILEIIDVIHVLQD